MAWDVGQGARTAAAALIWALVSACSGAAMPAPGSAAVAYAEAIEQGDARALRGLLSEEAQAELSEADVADLLRKNQREFAEQAAFVREATSSEGAAESSTSTDVQLVFTNGSRVRLLVEAGAFRLEGSGCLPAAPPTPEAALAELRLALARRSLPALLALLGYGKREEIEGNLEALAAALEKLDLAVVEMRDDRAQVDLPGGLRVLLSRTQGSWRIEEIQ